MANTAISTIATDSIVLEGKDRVKKVAGTVAATGYKPGDWVYQTATDTWTTVTAAVVDYAGVLEFKKRTSSTFGEVDIDITYSTSDMIEVIVGPRDGTLKLATKVEDLGANYYYGKLLSCHSGGSMELNSTQGTTCTVQCIITEDGYTDDDTVTKVYMV